MNNPPEGYSIIVLTVQEAIEEGNGCWKRLPAALCTDCISRCIERFTLDRCRVQRFGRNNTVNETEKQKVLVSRIQI